MTEQQRIQQAIDDHREQIKAIDDAFFGDTIGVAQAIDHVKKALEEIDTCLNERQYGKASQLGYRDVASAFIFLQRVLGSLNDTELRKSALISEIAIQAEASSYEAVEPFVIDIMESFKPHQPLSPEELEAAMQRFRAKLDRLGTVE